MLRIRKIRDMRVPANRATVAEIQEILRVQFPGMSADDIAKLPSQLEDPLKHGFVSEIFVAETGEGAVRAFAVMLYFPTCVLPISRRSPPRRVVPAAVSARRSTRNCATRRGSWAPTDCSSSACRTIRD